MENLIWKVENGKFFTIKNMSNSHINYVLDLLYESNLQVIDEYSVPYWILNFERELNYRKRRDNTIIECLPKPFLIEYNKFEYNIKYNEKK